MLYRKRNTLVKEYILPFLRIAATTIKIKLHPTNNLCSSLHNNLRSNFRSNLYSNLRNKNLRKNFYGNLRSNLCKNLRKSLYNNLDPQTVSLISSNSYLFPYKYLINFRRFYIKENSIAPKVAIEVATSII